MTNLTLTLLKWYDKNGRELPWRIKGKAHPNPYFVWISEIMLQQTTVSSVIPYFGKWITHFPTLESVAKANLEEILFLWQGLGYYTRAKKIHECAKLFLEKGIPNNRDLLLKFPGIGPYTASSICAFAFNLPETVVDGNVIRVLSRLHGITTPVTKEIIFPLAHQLTSQTRGADYASAIMDLGATICKPNNPSCPECPWISSCQAYKNKSICLIPNIKKPLKEKRTGTLYLIFNDLGQIYIQQRQGKGLLSGLYEIPWNSTPLSPPLDTYWENLPKQITHTFTHFHLTLSAKKTTINHLPSGYPGFFVSFSDLKKYPFPTLIKKAIKTFLSEN